MAMVDETVRRLNALLGGYADGGPRAYMLLGAGRVLVSARLLAARACHAASKRFKLELTLRFDGQEYSKPQDFVTAAAARAGTLFDGPICTKKFDFWRRVYVVLETAEGTWASCSLRELLPRDVRQGTAVFEAGVAKTSDASVTHAHLVAAGGTPVLVLETPLCTGAAASTERPNPRKRPAAAVEVAAVNNASKKTRYVPAAIDPAASVTPRCAQLIQDLKSAMRLLLGHDVEDATLEVLSQHKTKKQTLQETLGLTAHEVQQLYTYGTAVSCAAK